MPSPTNVDVLCASHGNEWLGLLVHEQFTNNPVPMLRSRIAHPEAAEWARRYLGQTQIMDHYPGSLTGDPEDRAAARNMAWLGDSVGSEEVVIYDIHNNNHPGVHFMDIGSRALKAGIVGAYDMGFTMCSVRPDSFHDSVANAVALEIPVTTPAEYQLAARQLHRGLGRAARAGTEQLEQRYAAVSPRITFLRKYSIAVSTLTDAGQVRVTSDPHLIRRLESIEPGPPFSEFTLDKGILDELDIPSDRRLFMEGWGYQNMSPDLPDRGLYQGRPRKIIIGDFYTEADPPIEEGAWVLCK